MTANDFQRAELAAFCIRAAGEKAPFTHIKAIALAMRNRQRTMGFRDWMENIFTAPNSIGNPIPLTAPIDLEDRNVQRFLREVDEIFFSRPSVYDDPHPAEISLEEAIGGSLYWYFLNLPMRQWFRENILGDQENHRQSLQIGMLMFFE